MLYIYQLATLSCYLASPDGDCGRGCARLRQCIECAWIYVYVDDETADTARQRLSAVITRVAEPIFGGTITLKCLSFSSYKCSTSPKNQHLKFWKRLKKFNTCIIVTMAIYGYVHCTSWKKSPASKIHGSFIYRSISI